MTVSLDWYRVINPSIRRAEVKESGVLYKPGATMGVRDPSVTLNLSQDEL